MNWNEAAAYALRLDGAERSTSYGEPAIKANGRAILSTGHEAETSFVLHLDLALTEMLMETCPATFWKTPHYQGYGAVLVRYDASDDALVREMIERAHGQALARKPPRPRKPR